MSPTIRIDDGVYEALKSLAEPFVDTPNDVLRRVLSLDDGGSEKRDAPNDAAPQKQSSIRKKALRKAGKPKRSRLPAGALLPEAEYELPLLTALDELGGSAPTSEVLDRLGKKLESRFTPQDRETYGASGTVRWRNRAQFVRDKLVKGGEMSSTSPRGIWEITRAGRERIATTDGR